MQIIISVTMLQKLDHISLLAPDKCIVILFEVGTDGGIGAATDGAAVARSLQRRFLLEGLKSLGCHDGSSSASSEEYIRLREA